MNEQGESDRKSAEIVRFTGNGPVLEPEVGVISLLETVLARAKAGEIKGVQLVWIGANDDICCEGADGCAQRNLLVSGVAWLQFHTMHRLQQQIAMASLPPPPK